MLAQDATLFRHAFSTAQWTVPSHTSMFTGLYPDRHNMLHASSVLPSTLTPLAERLRDDGYFTAGFCNNPLIGVVNTGLARGFYSFLNYAGLMTSRPNETAEQRSLVDRYRYHFKRFLANVVTRIQDSFAHSDTLLDFSFSPLMVPLWQTALSFKGNTAKSLNDAVRLHIERAGVEKSQPIFSFINLMGTHMPYRPPSRFVEKFAPHVQRNKVEQRYLRQFNGDVFGWMAPLTSVIDEEHKATLDGMYNAEVANQDELVGTFLQRLRSSGALDRTLLIICADHGEHLGEKQLIGHSISLYNELVHVPLIIRDPNGDLPRGTTVNHVVSTRRIFHTALSAANSASNFEHSLTLTQGTTSDPEREHILAVGVTPQNLLHIIQRRRPDLIALRNCDQPRYAAWNGRYKLIQTGDSAFELYDILDDAKETVNLSDILPEQVEVLQDRLRALISHVGEDDVAVGDVGYEDALVYRRLRDLGYLE
jgi:arylsulfatase A-like enzyme